MAEYACGLVFPPVELAISLGIIYLFMYMYVSIYIYMYDMHLFAAFMIAVGMDTRRRQCLNIRYIVCAYTGPLTL